MNDHHGVNDRCCIEVVNNTLRGILQTYISMFTQHAVCTNSPMPLCIVHAKVALHLYNAVLPVTSYS